MIDCNVKWKTIDIVIFVLYKTKMTITNKNFLYKLSSIRQSAFSFLESEMANAGLKDVPPSFGDVLYAIHNQGAGYIKDIVDQTYKDKSTVSNIINQLVEKGYVEKRQAPEDGRRVRVQITDKAKRYIDAMSEISWKLKHQLFKNMSTEEQEILFMLLNKIEKNLNI